MPFTSCITGPLIWTHLGFQQVWKINNSQENEDHSPERVRCHLLALTSFYLSLSGELQTYLHVSLPPKTKAVLWAHAKMTAITETWFSLGQLSIHMVNVGGQQSEQEKWTHNSKSVTSIVFCVALLEYDQVLLEERNQNKLPKVHVPLMFTRFSVWPGVLTGGSQTKWQSLVLFELVISSRFLHAIIILFLNKISVFKNKLPKARFPLTFPRFSL
ncbi:guanine nucleotide binding protein, alpha subunit [Lactarius akahatsu]|uniref:Guanine nucleotide binding protein, alpha subunit n=1 Tax=Lactarius akahatsu TaxID=416441 RepID=A0AAD4Q7P0_9AGAM|nr:guanine nucleotide binding protein, alpha subunit [Lactarius akahatsu]